MLTRHWLAAALLSLSCMSAFAQVTFSTRSTGTISRDSTIPGLFSATAGTPFILEVSSVFPETVPWTIWPHWIDTRMTQSTISLTLGGTTHEFAGSFRMHLEVRNEPQGAIANRRVLYNVSLTVPGTGDRLSFGTHFYLAPESGNVTLFDLFDSGAPYPVSAAAANTASVWLYPAGQFNSYDMPGNAESVSYYTHGVPVAYAVPEPSAAAMLLGGFALLTVAARSRAR
jgi:hypothetical protein